MTGLSSISYSPIALLDDWVGEEPNDLLDFVPINWTINVNLTQYEIFLFTNQYNWVDLDNGGIENTRLAFCGSTGQITLDLPFTEFIPLKQLVHFTAKVRRSGYYEAYLYFIVNLIGTRLGNKTLCSTLQCG